MANAPDTPAAPAPTLWNSLVKPAVVLVLICAIVGFLLGSVDNLTLPTITANREARAWATYNALIPEATDFEALSCDVPGVTALMEADDDLGYAVIAQSKGYSSQVPMAVAFDDEGTITNVIGMDNTETPGLGTKVQLPDFTDQFLGRAAEPLTIDDIDAVTGATISSKAALAAVNEATTVPSESTTATFWPAEPLTAANAKGCSPLVKFCAMPLEPTMSTVPPVTVAVRS